LEILTNTNRRA